VELETKMNELQAQLKTYFDKQAEEEKHRGAASEETKKTIDAMQKQLDGIDLKLVEKHTAGAPEKSIVDELKENEDVCRLMKNKKGHAVITFKGNNAASLWDHNVAVAEEQKTILRSALGYVTPGVIDAERRPGIVLEARRQLTIRDVLSARSTSLPVVYWAKVNAPLVSASPMMQNEGLVKHENAVTFTTASSTVRTIATFIKASRQALDDFAELGGFLQTGLPYYVNRQEETQLLSGDNTGDNLNGLITQATSFNTALLPASSAYTRLDVIACAIEQIGVADEIKPSFIVLNTIDWWLIRRTKDSFGRYMLGDPQNIGNPTLWGLTPIDTNSIASGTFLVGSGDPAAAEIRDRMEMTVEISTEDSDNFQRNLVTIRAEKRMLLAVMRPGSYITGTFATSP
jgi:HK97 family phage major capsid protein